MNPLHGLLAGGLAVITLSTLILLAAVVLASFRDQPEPQPEGVAGVLSDRAHWHVFRAVVAASGAGRRVMTDRHFSAFLDAGDARTVQALRSRTADFLIVDPSGRPLLVVQHACGASDRFADSALMTAGIPLVRLDRNATLGEVGDRVRAALGEAINPDWPTGPALLSTRLGSTWG